MCHASIDRVAERYTCRILSKYSVFIMLLLSTASLVGISSAHQPAGIDTHVLQPALASPLPGVIQTQLLQPPLAPPTGLPPIQLPGLPPIQPTTPQQQPTTPQQQPTTPQQQPTTPQQQSSGGLGVR